MNRIGTLLSFGLSLNAETIVVHVLPVAAPFDIYGMTDQQI